MVQFPMNIQPQPGTAVYVETDVRIVPAAPRAMASRIQSLLFLLAVAVSLAVGTGAWAQANCGVPQGGSCVESHQTGGCAHQQCCQVVCGIYPDCCLQAWDEFCVDLANSECPFMCGSASAGDCYVPHQMPSCNNEACCQTVCAFDPACCQFDWDLICTFEAEQACDPPNPVQCGAGNAGSCTVPHGTPSCSDTACCQTVCGIDPSCCTQAWDVFCVQLANSYCFGCSLSCPSGSTLENELCGNRNNDACIGGQTPQGVSCGTKICGTIDGTLTGGNWSGDRDAYAFTATDTNGDGSVKITLRLASEFKGFAAMVPASCPVTLANAVLAVNAQTCLQSSVTGCVPPGNYWIIVAPGTFPTPGQTSSIACSTDPKYSLELECSQVSCGNTCSPTAGSCFEPHATPGCDTAQCCSAVCNVDPFCCSTAWDSDCVSQAGQLCNVPPPDNDECVDATPILAGETLQLNTLAANISSPAIPASCEEGQGVMIGRDVWFKHVATCSGNMVINTCGSSTDLRLVVYTGDCSTLGLHVCNTDSPFCSPATGARVQFMATCGLTYYIRVGGDNRSVQGTGQLTVTCPGPACCAPDFNHDGTVDGADLGSLLGEWGGCPACPQDLNGDDVVDGADLGSLLGEWGPC